MGGEGAVGLAAQQAGFIAGDHGVLTPEAGDIGESAGVGPGLGYQALGAVSARRQSQGQEQCQEQGRKSQGFLHGDTSQNNSDSDYINGILQSGFDRLCDFPQKLVKGIAFLLAAPQQYRLIPPTSNVVSDNAPPPKPVLKDQKMGIPSSWYSVYSAS